LRKAKSRAHVGYNYLLDTTFLGPGLHAITVLATDSDANPDVGSASVTVTVGPTPLTLP